jgi:hypothetical protein
MDHKIYQHLRLQDPSKFTQIWIFWFENKPSGNPDPDSCENRQRRSAPVRSEVKFVIQTSDFVDDIPVLKKATCGGKLNKRKMQPKHEDF